MLGEADPRRMDHLLREPAVGPVSERDAQPGYQPGESRYEQHVEAAECVERGETSARRRD